MNDTLERFRLAQARDYSLALSEIRSGCKRSHWMWYIFPQLTGLGKSSTSLYYGIADLEEAKAFLRDPVLGSHLRECSVALLKLESNDARMVLGSSDHRKLRSSMTLFAMADPYETVFVAVLEKFFQGSYDVRTLKMLGIEPEGL